MRLVVMMSENPICFNEQNHHKQIHLECQETKAAEVLVKESSAVFIDGMFYNSY